MPILVLKKSKKENISKIKHNRVMGLPLNVFYQCVRFQHLSQLNMRVMGNIRAFAHKDTDIINTDTNNADDEVITVSRLFSSKKTEALIMV